MSDNTRHNGSNNNSSGALSIFIYDCCRVSTSFTKTDLMVA